MKEGPHRSTLSPRPSPLRCRSYSYPSGARILVTHGLGLTTSLRRESRFLLPSLWLFFIMKVDVLLLDLPLQKGYSRSVLLSRVDDSRENSELRIKREKQKFLTRWPEKNIHTPGYRYFICMII